MTILRAHGLEKSFGRTHALRGVSIGVERGETVAITGPSGSGKSTLLHCLSGITRPDAGEVHYGERRVDDLSEADRTRLRRDDFGIVFQFGGLVPELTAAENIALPLLFAGQDREKAAAAAADLLTRLDITDAAGTRPAELSGGRLQRVAVARALVTRPTVIFADAQTGTYPRVGGQRPAGPPQREEHDGPDHRADRAGPYRHVVTTPLGVTRRARRDAPPHWYGLALAGLAVVVLAGARLSLIPVDGPAAVAFPTLLLVVGLMLSASRLVTICAGVAARRARSAETLLAARALRADPRPWGRTMSIVGLAVAVGAATGTFEEDILSSPLRLNAFWQTSFALVGAALLVAVAVAALALLVHQAEYLLENGTVLAGLHASGTSERELRRVLVRQALIAAVPICVIGTLTSLVTLVWPMPPQRALLLLPLANAAAVAGLGVLGAVLAAVSSRRRLRRAIAPVRLRTE